MTKPSAQNEELLMDFLAGQCEPAVSESVRQRLQDDEAFRRHHDNLAAALKALKLLPQAEAPSSLVDDTLARIRQRKCTNALVARESLNRAPGRGRFAIRDIAAVAASVVLLACVLVPSFRQAGHLATANQCAAQIGNIANAMSLYAEDNDQYLPSTGTAGAAGYGRWLPSDHQPSVSNSEGLFRLVSAQQNYADPSDFQCPGATGDAPATLAVSAGMIDFPEADYVSYSYQHSLAPSGIRLNDPVRSRVAETLAILADNTPMFQGGQFRPDRVNAKAGENHSQRGQNVLYMDMHVKWSDNASAGVFQDNIYLAEGVNTYDGDENPSGPTDSFLLPAFSKRK